MPHIIPPYCGLALTCADRGPCPPQAAVTETAELRALLESLEPRSDPRQPTGGLSDQLRRLTEFVLHVEAEWAAGHRAADCDSEQELHQAAEHAQVTLRDSR